MASKIDPPACSFCSIHSNQKHDIWWLLDTIFVYAMDTKQVATDKRGWFFRWKIEDREPYALRVFVSNNDIESMDTLTQLILNESETVSIVSL